jgi:diguanylate cyclase (GGDEF)-like protein
MLNKCADYWRQPDHYAWMVGYLRARGLDVRVRSLFAWATVSYTVLPVAMLWSPSGPHASYGRVAVIIASCSVLLSASASAWRWPSRRIAVAHAVTAEAGTAIVCLSYSDAVIGLVGCVTFAMLGGYIAFFHSLRLQALNLSLGLCAVTVLAVRALQATHDVIAVVDLYVVVTVAIVALSVTAHVMVHFLGGDLDASDTDPLTGLGNRRAFYRATHQLLAGPSAAARNHLTVMMVDLDNFKRINDSHGHRAGDRALIRVGQLLEDHAAEGAAVARVGGEEFLIAERADPSVARRRAAGLCMAIAASEFDLTASIGIASADLTAHPLLDDHALIDHLIDLADTAMYGAKRAGGNQTRHAQCQP